MCVCVVFFSWPWVNWPNLHFLHSFNICNAYQPHWDFIYFHSWSVIITFTAYKCATTKTKQNSEFNWRLGLFKYAVMWTLERKKNNSFGKIKIEDKFIKIQDHWPLSLLLWRLNLAALSQYYGKADWLLAGCNLQKPFLHQQDLRRNMTWQREGRLQVRVHN